MWWCRTAPADQPSAFIVNGDTGNQVFLPVGLQYMREGGGGGGGGGGGVGIPTVFHTISWISLKGLLMISLM